jgi:hypothetical protein
VSFVYFVSFLVSFSSLKIYLVLILQNPVISHIGYEFMHDSRAERIRYVGVGSVMDPAQIRKKKISLSLKRRERDCGHGKKRGVSCSSERESRRREK